MLIKKPKLVIKSDIKLNVERLTAREVRRLIKRGLVEVDIVYSQDQDGKWEMVVVDKSFTENLKNLLDKAD